MTRESYIKLMENINAQRHQCYMTIRKYPTSVNMHPATIRECINIGMNSTSNFNPNTGALAVFGIKVNPCVDIAQGIAECQISIDELTKN